MGLCRLLLCLTLLCAAFPAFSQESSEERQPWRRYKQAEDAFAAGHYRVAAAHARAFLAQASARTLPRTMGEALDKARYMLYTALLRTDAPGSADSAIHAMRDILHPAYRARLSLALAQYYFINRQLPEAIPYYEAAGIEHLTNKEITDSKFELAYSYFNTRRLAESEALFKTIRDVPEGKYYNAGNYYYGLLAYTAARYDEALTSFNRIDDLPDYRGIVPYYMAEIYYFQGDRKKSLDEAQRLLRRTDKLYYDNELHLLAAQILFEDGRYGDALPYFEHYYSNAQKVRKEELYEMGYSYYRVNEWPAAIAKFRPLSTARDSLGQTAMYLLGDCYLKEGDKRGARTAFGLCAAMPFNAGQREAALMLHARLSYELGFNSDAASSLTELLRDFPGSSYKDEARTLQSDLLVKSGDFSGALAAISSVEGRGTPAYGAVLQKAAYGRALQLLQRGDRNAGDSLLRVSLSTGSDDAYTAAARFWHSDVQYSSGNATEALSSGNLFVQAMAAPEVAFRMGGISPSATLQHAYLTLGYAAMDKGLYGEAREYLKKASSTGGDGRIAAAAALREADAAFMQKDFVAAAALYDRTAGGTGADADYARLQKAILLGLNGRRTEKIAILQNIIATNPPSAYAADAKYELSAQYLEDAQPQLAIPLLQSLTADRSEALAAKAGAKLGIAYQSTDEDDKAIAAYTDVVTNHPASEYRAAALTALKSIYIERNTPDAYAALLTQTGLSGGDDAELDSAFYAAGEARFAAGDWRGALTAFGKYAAQYPSGIFRAKSLYYTAESHYALKETEAALRAYAAVLATPAGDFTESSAGRAAAIAFSAKNYEDALLYYSVLDSVGGSSDSKMNAIAGQMRSSAALGSAAAASEYAAELLALPVLPEALSDEANYYRAKGMQAAGRDAEAAALFAALQKSKNVGIAVEARYFNAVQLFKGGKLKEAEAAVNSNIKLSGSDEYVVKNYFLLGDILTAGKDYFNARALLQSILKNNKDTEIKAAANTKLAALDTLEKEGSKLSEE